MPITSSAQVTCAFSLCCIGCDAGADIETPEQAIAEGWTEIEEDFDGRSWNYLGTCPECREEDERPPTAPAPREGSDVMDPNAAWSALADAIADDDWEHAATIADGLLAWLIRGGFPPAITGVPAFDAIVAKATCESIATWGV